MLCLRARVKLDFLTNSEQAALSVKYAFKFGHADRWAEYTVSPEFPKNLLYVVSFINSIENV